MDVDFSLNNTRISDDTISVTGSVVSGAESQRDVFVELAFEEETFGLTPIQKFNAETDGMAGLQELAGQATHLFYRTEEGQEGRNAFLEKRNPDFSGSPWLP